MAYDMRLMMAGIQKLGMHGAEGAVNRVEAIPMAAAADETPNRYNDACKKPDQGVRLMTYRFARLIATSSLLGLLATHAMAHTTVIDSSPKSGSTLAHSPPSIEITFREPVRLTSVVAVETGKPERKLEFAPTDSAAKFKLNDPKLSSGRAEIQWKALSKDGHVISGSLIFMIQPAAATTN